MTTDKSSFAKGDSNGNWRINLETAKDVDEFKEDFYT